MEDVVQVLQDLVRMRSDEREMEVVSYLADRFTVAGIFDGRMYGRGTSDAKGPLSAMVAAVESVARNGRPRRGYARPQKVSARAATCGT